CCGSICPNKTYRICCILFIQNELLNRLQHVQNLNREQLISPAVKREPPPEKVFL
ncbi:hypothetical protein OPU39_00990, partial [Acinetobacter nosocomialis]|nr:hypothetical protein [Acinetobacter nosocomialis]